VILVDTSVWINYFKGENCPETDRLDWALENDVVVMGDLILLEILQGFRNDRDYNRAKKYLESLRQFELFGTDMVDKCANNYRQLRKKGITIRKTADVIIASFCIENNLPLLFTDRDFVPFVQKLGLRSALDET